MSKNGYTCDCDDTFLKVSKFSSEYLRCQVLVFLYVMGPTTLYRRKYNPIGTMPPRPSVTYSRIDSGETLAAAGAPQPKASFSATVVGRRRGGDERPRHQRLRGKLAVEEWIGDEVVNFVCRSEAELR
jgi:hypothetical protein